MTSWNGLVVSTLRYLKVDAAPGRYELMPGIDLLVGDKAKRKYLNAEFRNVAGLIEYEHFSSADHLLVGEFEDDFCGKQHSSATVVLFWLVWLDWLLQDSWLIKDNSIVCEVAFCRVKNRTIEWSKNGLFSKAHTASGDDQADVIFTEHDLVEWNRLSNEVRKRFYSNEKAHISRSSSKEFSRFARFIHFASFSRRTPDPAMKISQNCSALESLFSTDASELSHRLSERVAFFLAASGHDAESTFERMKKCYGVRSKVTHGTHVKLRDDEVESLSAWMLVIMRDIAMKLIEYDEVYQVLNGKNDEIDAYFRKLIFCRAAADTSDVES